MATISTLVLLVLGHICGLHAAPSSVTRPAEPEPTPVSLDSRSISSSDADIIMNRKYVPLRNCMDILQNTPQQEQLKSGLYVVKPNDHGGEFVVYCDMELLGGGWTVIQRRTDGVENFDRPWSAYKNGFGDFSGSMWLGLEKIRRLTSDCDSDSEQPCMELYIGLKSCIVPADEEEGWECEEGQALYRGFRLSGRDYKITSDLRYESGVQDNLSAHVNVPFSTIDRDNDHDARLHCSQKHGGGWWYLDGCVQSNLNGEYKTGYEVYNYGVEPEMGILWGEWPDRDAPALQWTVMAIRPRS